MTRSCWTWSSWRCVSCSPEYGFPGDDAPVVRVGALKALEGDVEWQAKVMELMDAADSFDSGAGA